MESKKEEYRKLLDFCKTDTQRSTIQALIDSSSITQAAQSLSVAKRTVERTLARVRRYAANQGFAPENHLHHPAPPQTAWAGSSVLIDDEGNAKLTWLKTKPSHDAQFEAMKEAVEALKDEIPASTPTPHETPTDDDLASLYVISDYHLGMLSWPEETGDDWNTDIAEEMLYAWFEKAIESAPDSKVGIFAQLGDFLHFDGLEAVTPTSGHILDTDSRFQLITRVAIRALRRITQRLLEKHEKVHLIMATGNHDLSSAAWMREMLAAFYENEPRVSVDTNADSYYSYQHGDTSLFFHHGHKRKPGNVAEVFVAKYRDLFGSTKHSYAHMGHLHHDHLNENGLMTVEQHRTLAAKDAYASHGGWISGRGAKVITYHKKYGEVARATISPEMVSSPPDTP